jgi:hypothetical protein
MEKRDGFGIGELGRVQETTIEDEIEAARLQPAPRSAQVKCDCGHTCSRILVMSTSRGTSCPDCYDRMEDGG